MNLWHELDPGPSWPEVIHVVVEIPKGSRNKYEFHKRTGAFKLDRVLYSAVHYPGDYGFTPQTFYDDEDPLDVLVMTNLPTFTGCIVEARPIGMFRMLDRGEHDDKILAVLHYDPFFQGYTDFTQLPSHYIREVELLHCIQRLRRWTCRTTRLGKCRGCQRARPLCSQSLLGHACRTSRQIVTRHVR